MPYFRFRLFLYQCCGAFLLLSCQRAWVPSAELPPDTDIKVDAAIPAHPPTEAIIVPYRQQFEQRMNEVIGQSAQELLKIGTGESALGNFVTEVQLAQVLPLYGKPIDMSLMTTGGLRASLPQGPITLSHIFELSPFENQLVVATLTGTTVQKMFEHGARTKDLLIKNATFTIKDKQPAAILINGKPLNPQKNYTVVLSDYLVNGGDNLNFMQEAIKIEPAGILVREALIRHIRQLTAQNKSIEAWVDGRMKIL
jgi:2',3'-cyclic-nucleotide 2'-phosphodiesterase (5'-nucleotidase family)